jgi:hypothetical protein
MHTATHALGYVTMHASLHRLTPQWAGLSYRQQAAILAAGHRLMLADRNLTAHDAAVMLTAGISDLERFANMLIGQQVPA